MNSATLKPIKAPDGFTYDGGPQRSPQWVAVRVGKITASRLGDFLAVGKRDGKPLKARIDYEREITFEQQFGQPFERFTSAAMQAGIDYETFVLEQYSSATGTVVSHAGVFYSNYFAASPDGLVGDDGLAEVKVLKDTNYTDVLENGVPEKYMLQMQGQLYASGRLWCDFVAANLSTGTFKVIRVLRDEDTIERIAIALIDWSTQTEKFFETDSLFEFTAQLPTSAVNFFSEGE